MDVDLKHSAVFVDIGIQYELVAWGDLDMILAGISMEMGWDSS